MPQWAANSAAQQLTAPLRHVHNTCTSCCSATHVSPNRCVLLAPRARAQDHQLAVSAIEGSLLPDDMFAMPGSRGLLRCTDDIQEALTHLCKRRAEAVKQASAAVASSGGELLRGLDGVPEGKALTLLVQLRMDVLEAVRLLWESKAMMPMLRRTLERYLAACAQQRGR